MSKSVKSNATDLRAKILGNSSLKHIDTLAESVVFNDKDMIRTNIPALNIAFSGDAYGGFTSGLTVIAGPSKHFKSNLGLRAVAAYLNKYKDGVCLFIDSEFGITPNYLQSNGIDPDRVIHAPVEHIEQMKFEIVGQLDKLERNEHLIIFVDSLGNCPSKKELSDALEEKEKTDMSRAKSIKSLFRMVTPLLNLKDVPMVVINHVYEEQGAMFAKTIMSGGTGVYLSSDTILFISRAQEKEGTEVVGYNFNLRIEKSRFVKEKSVIPINVTWNGGVNPFSALFNIALECGIISETKKGFYSFVDGDTGEILIESTRKSTFGKEHFVKILKMKRFQEFVVSTYQIPKTDIQKELLDELEDVMK